MEVVDETAVRMLRVSLSTEVDDELAAKVAELDDSRESKARAAMEGGAGLGRK